MTDCIEWPLNKQTRYGKKRFGGKLYATHRLAYAWAHWDGVGDWKALPADMVVMHTCDNPACCNPAHLRLGTQVENIKDMERKGRGNRSRPGAENPACKLTEADIREIRSAKKWYGYLDAMSAKYGVDKSQLTRIRRGEAWQL